MSLELNPEVEREVLERAQAAGPTASDYIARLRQAAARSRRLIQRLAWVACCASGSGMITSRLRCLRPTMAP